MLTETKGSIFKDIAFAVTFNPNIKYLLVWKVSIHGVTGFKYK